MLSGSSTVSAVEKECESLVASLPALLQWQPSEESTLRASLDTQARHILSCAGYRDLENLISRLPEASQKRLIFAPAFGYVLRSGAPATLMGPVLTQFVQAERCLIGLDEWRRNPVWTALGDYLLGSEVTFAAKRVEGIVLDTRSPFRGGISPKELGKVEDLTERESDFMEGQIRACLTRIDRVRPFTAIVVRRSAQSIALGKTRVNRPGSTSIPAKIGIIALTDYQNGARTVAYLCDALIHESIHSLIFRMELDSPFVSNREAGVRLGVTSPWTGNSIPLHAFLHACCVWFGLWNFWKLDTQDEEVVELKNRAAKGFQKDRLSRYVGDEAIRQINPQCRVALEQMQEIVAGTTE